MKKTYQEACDDIKKSSDTEVREPSALSSSEARVLDQRRGPEPDKYPYQGSYTVKDMLEMPEKSNAELIDGVIYDRGAPTLPHDIIVTTLVRRLADFMDDVHGSCHVFGSNVDIQLFPDSDRYFLEPDISVICDRDKWKNGEWIIGAPDLVIEVLSKSTRSRDMGIKLWRYHDSGVREYWIIDPKREIVTVYKFAEDMENTQVNAYDFTEKVPVGIWDDTLEIDFADIHRRIQEL